MKPRLFACIAVLMAVVSASALSSRIALARGGQESQLPKAESEQRRSEDHSSDIDKALKAYDERMDKCVDNCRQELDRMKKDLHELIDMRISMAVALAELRAKNAPAGAHGAPGTAYPPGAGQGSPKHQAGGVENAGLSRELQQIHNQLRSELEQQDNQVAQLASQIRAMKEQGQGQQSGQAGSGQRPQGQQGNTREAERR